ncbi:MAG: xylose isomerase [Planctomycetota bacterium]|nr:MAG: xylose isomerase [Planctomycetota bacterium]
MRLGYNTNGFPQHTLEQIARVLAELGYDALALTPDVFQLNPFTSGASECKALRSLLADLGLAVVVETGARFVLDPARKHQPTLLSPPEGAARRLDLLRRCFDQAHALGAETFSFWSGSPELPASPDALLDRLCEGAAALLDHAAGATPRVCFEPEPGMFIDSLAQLDAFLQRLARPELLVMLDVGHVPVTESISAHDALRRLAPRLGGLQLDDSRDAVHEHLLPGDGELDFPAIFKAAHDVGFEGIASVELPRHGHDPVTAARAAYEFLARLRTPH